MIEVTPAYLDKQLKGLWSVWEAEGARLVELEAG